MQATIQLNRAPLCLMRSPENFTGLADLISTGRHGLNDGFNLRRVNAPHSGKAHGFMGQSGALFDGAQILDFCDHTMRWCLAIGMTSTGDL